MTPRVNSEVRTPDGMKGTVQGRPFEGQVRVGILRQEWKLPEYPGKFTEKSPIVYVSYPVEELEEI